MVSEAFAIAAVLLLGAIAIASLWRHPKCPECGKPIDPSLDVHNWNNKGQCRWCGSWYAK